MTGAGAGLPLGSLSLVPSCLAFFRLRGLLSSHCQGWLPSGGTHHVWSAALRTPVVTADEWGDEWACPEVAPAGAAPNEATPTSVPNASVTATSVTAVAEPVVASCPPSSAPVISSASIPPCRMTR